MVADAALFNGDHLRELDQSGTTFITRVPETLAEAKEVLAAAEPAAMNELAEGYQGLVHRSDYGETQQRWLVVHSEATQARAARSVPRRLAKQHEREQKAWHRFVKHRFACCADTTTALEAFTADLVARRLEAARELECQQMPGRELRAKRPRSTIACKETWCPRRSMRQRLSGAGGFSSLRRSNSTKTPSQTRRCWTVIRTSIMWSGASVF
jgi:hypothetical protein